MFMMGRAMLLPHRFPPSPVSVVKLVFALLAAGFVLAVSPVGYAQSFDDARAPCGPAAVTGFTNLDEYSFWHV
jgi:hypothetical protein